MTKFEGESKKCFTKSEVPTSDDQADRFTIAIKTYALEESFAVSDVAFPKMVSPHDTEGSSVHDTPMQGERSAVTRDEPAEPIGK